MGGRRPRASASRSPTLRSPTTPFPSVIPALPPPPLRSPSVIPAQAGTRALDAIAPHRRRSAAARKPLWKAAGMQGRIAVWEAAWLPACAGMTEKARRGRLGRGATLLHTRALPPPTQPPPWKESPAKWRIRRMRAGADQIEPDRRIRRNWAFCRRLLEGGRDELGKGRVLG